jgi:hypothetical protein
MKNKPIGPAILAFLTMGGIVFFFMTLRGGWPPSPREWFVSTGAGILSGALAVFLLLFPAESGELRQQIIELAQAVISLRSGSINFSQSPAPVSTAKPALSLEDRVVASLKRLGFTEEMARAKVAENLDVAAAFVGMSAEG